MDYADRLVPTLCSLDVGRVSKLKKNITYFVKVVVSFLHHAEDEGNFFQLPFIGRQQGGWDLRGWRNESLNHLRDLKYREVLR